MDREMENAIVPRRDAELAGPKGAPIPALIAAAGDDAVMRYVEYFTAHIRNPNPRRAYFRNALLFLRWCEDRGIADMKAIKPVVVAAYIEGLQQALSKPSVKQHLAT